MGMDNLYHTYILNPFVEQNSFRTENLRSDFLPDYGDFRKLLPQPRWNGHETAIDCYWKTWEIAYRNLRLPTLENGFVSPYIDTAFNGNLFMWDSAFILMFARYGRNAFNFQQTLDNFYAKQHPDGFICREIRETDGTDCFLRFDPPATGPNVLPWTEWEYYQNFGDQERLTKVFPALLAYHQWFRRYRTWQDGTYWACGWACGMDNQPRLDLTEQKDRGGFLGFYEWWDTNHMIWVDTCFQALFSAQILIEMAGVLERREDIHDLENEIEHLKEVVNDRLWDDKASFYFDRRADGRLSQVKTIGAYWALLSGVIPKDYLDRFISHLKDKDEFNRLHRVPSLSADHPDFDPKGSYWRGGVWAPTNYMILRGLTSLGYHALTREIGINHHANVINVFEKTGTLWENYSPDNPEPGNIARSDFVGWSGLPSVAVLFEYVFGLRPEVPKQVLTWDVSLLEEHSVSQYPFGSQGILDLHCKERNIATEKPIIKIHANVPFTLFLNWEGGSETIQIHPDS
jgi:hypothetical protein